MRKRDEHFVSIPCEDAHSALEGIYLAGVDADAVGVVVAAPHPLYGGSMDSPVVNELAHAARGAGMASLRFNWRGVGGSAGEVSGEIGAAVADYGAALQQMFATVPGAVVAAGYSFGAGAAVGAATGEPESVASGQPVSVASGDARRVRRLLLVAPPPAMLDVARLSEFSGSVLLIAAADDAWAPAAELEAIAAELPRAHFRCIADADHFFGVGLDEIGRIAAAWLEP